ncbi:MAG: sugar:sodium symporter, partial [Lachnospiraceae bacterium]|nr:sugar:sodium symporter [Lachnospiraceae bacterium]
DTSSTAAAAAGSSVVGLRMTMTVVPIVGLLIAVFLFHKKYILSEQKVEEIARQIKQKRAKEA